MKYSVVDFIKEYCLPYFPPVDEEGFILYLATNLYQDRSSRGKAKAEKVSSELRDKMLVQYILTASRLDASGKTRVKSGERLKIRMTGGSSLFITPSKVEIIANVSEEEFDTSRVSVTPLQKGTRHVASWAAAELFMSPPDEPYLFFAFGQKTDGLIDGASVGYGRDVIKISGPEGYRVRRREVLAMMKECCDRGLTPTEAFSLKGKAQFNRNSKAVQAKIEEHKDFLQILPEYGTSERSLMNSLFKGPSDGQLKYSDDFRFIEEWRRG